MDDARFMLDCDKLVSMNYGLSLFSGVTGGVRMLDAINIQKFGLEHTGQLGDVTIGTFMRAEDDTEKTQRAGLHSLQLADMLAMYPIPQYEDQEIYMYNVRGFLGAMSSHIMRRNYTEVASPFFDIDLLEFCMSVPLRLRINHVFYSRWIKEKYPDTARIPWATTGLLPGASQWRVRMKSRILNRTRMLKKALGIPLTAKEKGMNPLDEWFNENPVIRQVWDAYYQRGIASPSLSNDVREAMKYLYVHGNVTEKSQILTALSAIHLYGFDG